MTEVQLHGTTDSMDVSLSKLRETVKDREAWSASWCCKVLDMTETKQLIKIF